MDTADTRSRGTPAGGRLGRRRAGRYRGGDRGRRMYRGSPAAEPDPALPPPGPPKN